MRSAHASLLSILAFVVAIAGCSSGPGEDPAVTRKAVISEAEGVWSGYRSYAPTFNYETVALILENGELWAISTALSGGDVWNFLQGDITTAAGPTFVIDDVRELGNGMTPNEGRIQATVQPKFHILGQLDFTVDRFPPQRWELALVPIAQAHYRYDVPASSADALGQWVGSIWSSNWEGLGAGSVSIAVGNDGSFSGALGACTFSGSIKPRASGKNVFDATFTISAASGAAVCSDAGTVTSGVGLIYRLQDGRQRLVLATKNAVRDTGVLFFADR